MLKYCLVLVASILLVQGAIAQQSQPNRQDWLLCQAGAVERCDHILMSQIDPETRMLVEADRQYARERISALVRALMTTCDTRSYVRACDRALSFNLTMSDRQEVLNLRRSVVQRGLIPVGR